MTRYLELREEGLNDEDARFNMACEKLQVKGKIMSDDPHLKEALSRIFVTLDDIQIRFVPELRDFLLKRLKGLTK